MYLINDWDKKNFIFEWSECANAHSEIWFYSPSWKFIELQYDCWDFSLWSKHTDERWVIAINISRWCQIYWTDWTIPIKGYCILKRPSNYVPDSFDKFSSTPLWTQVQLNLRILLHTLSLFFAFFYATRSVIDSSGFTPWGRHKKTWSLLDANNGIWHIFLKIFYERERNLCLLWFYLSFYKYCQRLNDPRAISIRIQFALKKWRQKQIISKI